MLHTIRAEHISGFTASPLILNAPPSIPPQDNQPKSDSELFIIHNNSVTHEGHIGNTVQIVC
jgi:hypothetical protein